MKETRRNRLSLCGNPTVLAVIACLLPGTLSVATVAGEDMNSPSVRSALGQIMTEDRVVNSAYSVCERAAKLPAEQQFELLASFVLPSPDHDTLRLAYDMTPTCPSPLVRPTVGAVSTVGSDEATTALGIPRFSGSEFASPALELVRVATTLGRLPEIRNRVTEWKATGVLERKAVAAMLSAIAGAEQNLPEAELQLEALLQLVRDNTQNIEDRTPETFALWATTEHEGQRAIANELGVILVEDMRRDQPRRSERWKRIVTAQQEALLAPTQVGPATTPAPSMWIPVSRMFSATRGGGYPHPVWRMQPGKVSHSIGHDQDYLYYRSPLTGQFTVEADATTFDFHDIHLAYGGLWTGVRWDLKAILNGNFRDDRRVISLQLPLTRVHDTMRVRMDVTHEKSQFSVNGRPVHSSPRQVGSDPWLSIHSWSYTIGTISNLRITGEPLIPDVVTLATPDLAGWQAYYDESVGSQNADWFALPIKDASVSSRASQKASPAQPRPLALFGRRHADRHGTFSESLLRYHRPMIEDGTIEYEFYFAPGESHVHPALDRMCLILNPSGVDVHWATDGRHDPTDIGSDNLVSEPQHRKSQGPLPLKPAEWNQLRLTTRGDTVDVMLNGVLVFSRPLEPTNLRTFGLFHWAEQSDVRVRNLRWTGDWPKQLEPPQDQSLADHSLDEELGDRTALKGAMDYQFQEGLPSHLFSITGDDWQSHVKQVDHGLQVTRTGAEYLSYAISSPLTLQGDFDIIAEFDEFKSKVESGGEGNIELTVSLDDEHSSAFHLFRKHFVFPENRQEQLVQVAISQKRGMETQYSFLEAPAEEAVSGRLRLVRRGTTLFGLFAEGSSNHYRLIHRETVSRDEARFRLIVGHNKSGATTVIWKSLDVRAEGSSGVIAGPLKTVAELDAERLKLPAHREWDFRAETAQVGKQRLSEFSIFGETAGQYFPDREGLRIDVPGTDQWAATGLGSRQQIEGDFDIALEFDILHLEPCLKYNESCVFLQTEFRDKLQSSIETKFSMHHAGDRKAKTQLRRLRRNGEFEYQELVSQPSENATLLRLARRGDVVYQIVQSTTQKSPVILGAVQLGREPVIPGDMRALIHTGGDNRLTSVRFRTLRIWAEKLIEPK